MCGIAGYFDKKTGALPSDGVPCGTVLLSMLQALAPRGPDGTGVAIYGPTGEGLVLWLKVGEDSADAALAALLEKAIGTHCAVAKSCLQGAYLRLEVSADADVEVLSELAVSHGAELVSAGRQLEIVKGTGSPDALEAVHHISGWQGRHGLGHTRMSTESRIDLSHSQPFWAKGVPDLAIVHNGHITNYHRLRNLFEEKGVRFYTHNDSEVIGVYLRHRLELGDSLEEALNASRRDFDGSFCYLAATTDSFAFVKDIYGFKPLVVAETDDFVAVATEEVALRAALPEPFAAKEPPTGAIRIWNFEAALV